MKLRFRSNFAYVDGEIADGPTIPLCRLRYGGMASMWGFAIYRASHDDYEDSFLPSGSHGWQSRGGAGLRRWVVSGRSEGVDGRLSRLVQAAAGRAAGAAGSDSPMRSSSRARSSRVKVQSNGSAVWL